jgi:hypothetical protein
VYRRRRRSSRSRARESRRISPQDIPETMIGMLSTTEGKGLKED